MTRPGPPPVALWRRSPYAAVLATVVVTLLAPGPIADSLVAATQWFLGAFDWLILLTSSACVLACLGIAVSPMGALRLGGADARPEYGALSWFSMLFAAGMGAGLVFWGAAEPLIHTLQPPLSETPIAPAEAMSIVLFHWTIHPWAIYAVSALAAGFFAYRHDAPLTPSAPLHSLKGGDDRAAFRVIDWVALIAVLFGVVASLGQGVLQMGAGAAVILERSQPDNPLLLMAVLTVLGVVYLGSAASGLDRGIKPLSDLNMALCALMIVFVAATGQTLYMAELLWSGFLAYAGHFLSYSFDLGRLNDLGAWGRDWTLTSFLWWIAWGPFVGIFVARISKGRTLREFVLGVVIAPSLFSLVWFSVFGGAAIHAQLVEGLELGVDSFATAPLAAYALLENGPFALAAQIATFLLVFIFMVTSADSGAYVLGMFAGGGRRQPGVRERLFWGLVLAGFTAGALLSGEGQRATRAFAVAGAMPLLFLLLWQMARLAAALRADSRGASQD
ncbi:MAG: BCCT family transporter [Pseudomonadota bacterium]